MGSKEALQEIKQAPTFMGGNPRYMYSTQSSELFLEDIKIIERDLDKLGELEDTFEIMGKMKTTPVIWKLENGKTVEKSFKHHQMLYNPTHHSIDVYIFEFECSLPMKDYKKTWWLKGEIK